MPEPKIDLLIPRRRRKVEDAQGREAPIQRLADSIVGPFVYSLMTLSTTTFAFWRLLMTEEEASEFLAWLSPRERVLMQMSVVGILADIVVSKDGNGTYKTIQEAIKEFENSNRRIIIYVRAGRLHVLDLLVSLMA